MNVIVCLKRVPEVTEVDLEPASNGKGIKEEGLVYALNDWDNYALEEAVSIKEKYGGRVTAITVGPEEAEQVLRRALALGADEAIRITDPIAQGCDAFATAKILAAVIKSIPYDIILTGVQASDDGYAQVGASVAELLGITHATLVVALRLNGSKATVHRELEGGMGEELEIDLPALFTIQSGINEPRYVSVMGIRKVAQKEIRVANISSLCLSAQEVGEAGSMVTIERLFLPPTGVGAEIIRGTPDEVAARVASIFEKGGLI